MATNYIISDIVLRSLKANASDRFPRIASVGNLHMRTDGSVFEYLAEEGWMPIENTESIYTKPKEETIDVEYEEINPKKLTDGR